MDKIMAKRIEDLRSSKSSEHKGGRKCMIKVLGDADDNILTCPSCKRNLAYKDSDVREYRVDIQSWERGITCPVCKSMIQVPQIF
jgi:hypothetical protein